MRQLPKLVLRTWNIISLVEEAQASNVERYWQSGLRQGMAKEGWVYWSLRVGYWKVFHLGDFSSQVVIERETWSSVREKWPAMSKPERSMLLNFGVSLSVTNTNFDHDGSHKYTCHQVSTLVGFRLIINFLFTVVICDCMSW